MYGSHRKDRLSPPLMFAFRSAHAARDAKKRSTPQNEAGERVVPSRRSAGRVPITESQLRREVARDLESLMNTVALESADDIQPFEYVRKSILNFGFPDIAHRSIDEISVDDVKDEICTVLMNYESRLIRGTIHVTRDNTVDAADL